MILNKSNLPKLDLHGENVGMVYPLLNEFINDNLKLKNRYLIVIHGKSTNILTKEVHRLLKKDKRIKTYQLDNWNLGETIIELAIFT